MLILPLTAPRLLHADWRGFAGRGGSRLALILIRRELLKRLVMDNRAQDSRATGRKGAGWWRSYSVLWGTKKGRMVLAGWAGW